MTRVDFYLLPDSADRDSADTDSKDTAPSIAGGVRYIETVCKLIEKATRQKKTVFVNVPTQAMADTLDTALWEFRSESFIPHRTLTKAPGSEVKSSVGNKTNLRSAAHIAGAHHEDTVEIAFEVQPLPCQDACHHVLINLANDVPAFFSRFERTLEVVGPEEDQRASSRKRYSYYKERGYPLNHHKLT